jgi:RNA recognition motif-containing protein
MLFVANLGFNVDDAGLAAIFTDAGITVVSARVVVRRYGPTRRSKGFGFVDVGGEAEQVKAIQALEGKDVDGRTIAVKVAVNTPRGDFNDAEVVPGTAV